MKDNVYDSYVFLRFMQLFSANSPIGNFNYSHGLELSVERGWINSISKFIVWQTELMYGQLCYLDLPIIHRFYYCFLCNDKDRFVYYLHELLSFRDTYELRLEEQNRGEIIVKLMLELGLLLDDSWSRMLKQSMLASVAWIGHIWGIPLRMLCFGYAYNNLESNIFAGLKLIPFGQYVAQRLLIHFSKLLPKICERVDSVQDGELGSSFPFQGVSSSCHEVQNARLFRS